MGWILEVLKEMELQILDPRMLKCLELPSRDVPCFWTMNVVQDAEED